ncbi:hypothetical protein [Paenibacillus sp. IHBB 10380]|uniref:hypothetical protein n=1 Tax=Paenibacillus sp. IHBB 10380 TaxID=1566358 RepID=UPI0005CFC998|nr:hypothetical protein [Paenibacillus sp. IHBB 10380]AJS60735.1 hypothetical protein UB51_22295 [Paenibacillus sp. IHBB 10380]
MIEFGQTLSLQSHFKQHYDHLIPVQVLQRGVHVDIGHIAALDENFIEIDGTLYNKQLYTFISRAGY